MHLSEIVIGHGMTETSPANCPSATDDTLERRVATVGRVLPHVEAKVTSLRHFRRSRARCCDMRDSPLGHNRRQGRSRDRETAGCGFAPGLATAPREELAKRLQAVRIELIAYARTGRR